MDSRITLSRQSPQSQWIAVQEEGPTSPWSSGDTAQEALASLEALITRTAHSGLGSLVLFGVTYSDAEYASMIEAL